MSATSSPAASLLIAVTLLAACSAGGNGASTGSSRSASAAARPSVQAPAFVFEGSMPVVSTDLVKSSQAFINPGAVIRDGSMLHMFANAFTAWPGHVDFYHLTSTDGVTWTPASADPIFTSDDVPYAKPGAGCLHRLRHR